MRLAGERRKPALSRRRDPAAAHQTDSRPDNAVGHHENGYRRAADDVRLRRPLLPGGDRPDPGPYQLVDRLDYTAFRHPNEHNRLLVLDEFDTLMTPSVSVPTSMLTGFRVANGAGKISV
jgi:hypothetical protein